MAILDFQRQVRSEISTGVHVNPTLGVQNAFRFTVLGDNGGLIGDYRGTLFEYEDGRLVDGAITSATWTFENGIVLGTITDIFAPVTALGDDIYFGRIDDMLPNILSASDTVIARSDQDDLIFGHGGNDELRAFKGNDSLNGGIGEDLLEGGPGSDLFLGGDGFDTVSYQHSTDAVQVRLTTPQGGINGRGGDAAGDRIRDVESLIGSAFGDILEGSEITDWIFGGGGNDTIEGNETADVLIGGPGRDSIDGGLGKDALWGGQHGDEFVYESLKGSGVSGRSRDIILDFDATDRIDLSGVTPRTLVFRGDEPFTGVNQIRVVQQGEVTIVAVNTGGTLRADMAIGLANTDAATLTAADFVL